MAGLRGCLPLLPRRRIPLSGEDANLLGRRRRGPPHFRFYAGAPLVGSRGERCLAEGRRVEALRPSRAKKEFCGGISMVIQSSKGTVRSTWTGPVSYLRLGRSCHAVNQVDYDYPSFFRETGNRKNCFEGSFSYHVGVLS